jgi:hypothetical protein
MDSVQIKNGFSDLKDDFRTRLRIQKSMIEIRLWFSVSNGEVYMHDYENNESNLIIAMKNDLTGEWRIFLKKNTYKHSLVQFLTGKYPLEILQKKFNEYYRLHGHGLF